jgi:hypothetical protein
MKVRTVSVCLFVFSALILFLGTFKGGPPVDVYQKTALESLIAQIPQMIASAILLAAALFIILRKKYAAADKHWAYGAVGTIVGYWLHLPNWDTTRVLRDETTPCE